MHYLHVQKIIIDKYMHHLHTDQICFGSMNYQLEKQKQTNKQKKTQKNHYCPIWWYDLLTWPVINACSNAQQQ